MKIAELSRQSGVPVPTIKFYLREGLLPPGERSAANQADYGPDHLRRLAFIRVLREQGRIPVAAIRRVAEALESREVPVYSLMGVVVDALGGGPAAGGAHGDGDEHRRARDDVDRFLGEHGWSVRDDAAARVDLVDALVQLRRHFAPGLPVEAFDCYLRAAEEVARSDLASVAPALQDVPDRALEAVVLGTVLFEPVLLALRRLAHEQLARELVASPRPSRGGPGGGARRQVEC
jgi:DNA-binding transcriptional MerR regulator